MRPPRHSERGAALLVVMVGVAVLTALAVDLAYDARVSLQIAANGRDELRASYRARSGVAMARLVLGFQQQLDEAIPKPAGGAAPSIPRIQLWRLVPVGPELTSGLFGGGPPAAAPAEGGRRAPESYFESQIEDEGRKVNVQLEGLPKTNAVMLAAQAQAIYQLVCDPRWDPLFEREDANGVRATRAELLVHLRDWVDEGSQTSALAANFGGGSCAMTPQEPPFQDEFGDENQPYDRGEDRYRTKNARMDSLEELFMVAGVSDAFMAAFGDQLTVYLPRDAKRNVNELDRKKLVELAKIAADPPGQAALFTPEFGEKLQTIIAMQTAGGIFAYSPVDFGKAVEAAGVLVNQNKLQQGKDNPFTDTSSTFHIRSTGVAGAVKTALDVVVRLDDSKKTPQGTPVSAPGKVIHWREE